MTDAEDFKDAIVGIDPGQTGGIAFLDHVTGGVLHLVPMMNCAEFADLMDMAHPKYVFLEKAHAMPKQGVTSVFNYGHHAGQLEGVLVALGLVHELVTPQAWQKELHAGVKKDLAPKERSLIAAQRWFPRVNLLATERSKKPHLGFIDALLIAEYGRRRLKR